MIEVFVDEVELKKVERALKSLEPLNFIRPELPPFGAAVIEVMQVYPAEGIVLKSSQQLRKEKAIAGTFGGLLGMASLLSSMVSAQVSGGQGPEYNRTGHYRASWSASLARLEERIINDAEYAGFVGGLDASPGGRAGRKGDQPYTWRYGWRRLKKVAQAMMDDLIPRLEQKALGIWKR